MIKGLCGTTIWSEDMNNLLPFYRDTLGLKVSVESPEFVVLGATRAGRRSAWARTARSRGRRRIRTATWSV